MNEKLLEQRAEEYIKNNFVEHSPKEKCFTDYEMKEIAIEIATEETKLLSEHILELQKDKGKLIDENKEAREIIKEFSDFANLNVEYNPEHPQEHTDKWNKLCERAEQFLGER